MNRLSVSAAIAGLAASIASGAAHATPLSGTFHIKIYQGTNTAGQTGPDEQANLANPLILTNPVGNTTFMGSLNFSPILNTIDAFLTSGGIYSGPVLTQTLSDPGFGLTTVFVIKGNTGGDTLGGTVTHDDGASLYAGAALTPVFESSAPTSAIPSAYSNLKGEFTLVYVEANGLPAVLDFEVTSRSVPEPATLSVLGAGLLGVGLLRRRSKA